MPDIETVTDHLYGVARSDFVASRNMAARQARAAGDPELAARISALRKPTVAAWALDQVARRDPALVADVAGLGAEIRSAMASGPQRRGELRPLLGRRVDVVARARDRALVVVREAEGPASAAVTQQIEQTLRAAIASPAIADRLVAGCLVEPCSEVELDVGLVGVPAGPGRAGRPGGTERTVHRRDEIRAAERAVREAERAVTARSDRRDELARRVDEARSELRRLEAELHEARDALRVAEQHRRESLDQLRAMSDASPGDTG